MAEQTPPSEKPTEPVASAAEATPPAAEAAPPKTDAAPAAPVTPEATPPAEKPAETPPVEAAKTPDEKPTETPALPQAYELKGVEPSMVAALTPVFRESGITPEAAQKLADTFIAQQKALIPQIVARDLDALRKDPELGQLNFGRTQQRVNDALAAFTTPEERAALSSLGLANNPTLVRMFHRIGASMQEPPQTDAGERVRERAPPSSKLYGGRDLVTDRRTN